MVIKLRIIYIYIYKYIYILYYGNLVNTNTQKQILISKLIMTSIEFIYESIFIYYTQKMFNSNNRYMYINYVCIFYIINTLVRLQCVIVLLYKL